MVVAIPNFKFSYKRKGKPVFVPTGIGERIGREVKNAVEAAYDFDPMYYHLRRGGHVAAMHHHRENTLFSRIDIANFFYSVSRRRVQSALDRIGISNARFYAQWSTIINPYENPKFSLPYGFVQSPILASLVLAKSEVGEFLRSLPATVSASVYMDDISLSSNCKDDLENAFKSTIDVLNADGFECSSHKLREPAPVIDIFNCDLSHQRATVREERIAAFYAEGPSQESETAFTAYCASVEDGNQS